MCVLVFAWCVSRFAENKTSALRRRVKAVIPGGPAVYETG